MPDATGNNTVVFTEQPIIVSQDTMQLLQQISQRCIDRGETIAVAESVTSGLVQALLSMANAAQEFYQGGITVYNCAQKAKHLGIEPIKANRCNGVSAAISAQLSRNICKSFSSEWGIGITGYASKVPEQGIDELYAYAAISKADKILFQEQFIPEATEAPAVQMEYATRVVRALAGLI